jgi:hypothetical protein
MARRSGSTPWNLRACGYPMGRMLTSLAFSFLDLFPLALSEVASAKWKDPRHASTS